MNYLELATKIAEDHYNIRLFRKLFEESSSIECLAVWYLSHTWMKTPISGVSNIQLHRDPQNKCIYLLSHKRIYVRETGQGGQTKYVIPIHLIFISSKVARELPEEVIAKLLNLKLHVPYLNKLEDIIQSYEKSDRGILELLHIAIRCLASHWSAAQKELMKPYRDLAEILSSKFNLLNNYINKCFIEEVESSIKNDIMRDFKYTKAESMLTLSEHGRYSILGETFNTKILAQLLRQLVQIRALHMEYSDLDFSDMRNRLVQIAKVHLGLGRRKITLGYGKDSGKYVLTGSRIEYVLGRKIQSSTYLEGCIFDPSFIEQLPSPCCLALVSSEVFTKAILDAFGRLSQFVLGLEGDEAVAFCLAFRDVIEKYIRMYKNIGDDKPRLLLMHLLLLFLTRIIDTALSKVPIKKLLNKIVVSYFMLVPAKCKFLKETTWKLEEAIILAYGWARARIAHRLNLHYFEVTFGYKEIVRETARRLAEHVLNDPELKSPINIYETLETLIDEYLTKLESRERTEKEKREEKKGTKLEKRESTETRKSKILEQLLKQYVEQSPELAYLLEEEQVAELEHGSKKKLASIYLCENCDFVFASYRPVDACPLCGERKVRKLFDAVPEKLPTVIIDNKEYYDAGYIDASCSQCRRIFRVFLTVPREKFDTCPYCGGEIRYFTEKYCLDIASLKARKACLEMYNEVAKLVEEEEK